MIDDKLLAVHRLDVPLGVAVRTSSDTGDNELHATAHLEQVPLAAKSLVNLRDYAMSTTRYEYVERVYDVSPDDFRVAD